MNTLSLRLISLTANIDTYNLTVTPTANVDSISRVGRTTLVFIKSDATFTWTATASGYTTATGTITTNSSTDYYSGIISLGKVIDQSSINPFYYQPLPVYDSVTDSTVNTINNAVFIFRPSDPNAIYILGEPQVTGVSYQSLLRYDTVTKTRSYLTPAPFRTSTNINRQITYDESGDKLGLETNQGSETSMYLGLYLYNFSTNTWGSEEVVWRNTTGASTNVTLSDAGDNGKFFYYRGSSAGSGCAYDYNTKALTDLPAGSDFYEFRSWGNYVTGLFYENKWYFSKNVSGIWNLYFLDMITLTKTQHTFNPNYPGTSDKLNLPGSYIETVTGAHVGGKAILNVYWETSAYSVSLYNPIVYDLPNNSVTKVCEFLVRLRRKDNRSGVQTACVFSKTHLYDVLYDAAQTQTFEVRRTEISNFM